MAAARLPRAVHRVSMNRKPPRLRTPKRRWRLLAAACAMVASGASFAQVGAEPVAPALPASAALPDLPDVSSLPSLPDPSPGASTSPSASAPSPDAAWRGELWRQHVDWRNRPAAESNAAWRAVLDIRHEWRLGGDVSLNLSNRFEALRPDGDAKPDRERNALREIFATWRATPSVHLDLGRINSRQGMATGYNPTDFLKAFAVVSRVSQDPSALRENRLGTAMLRGQVIAAWGAAQVSVIPRLSGRDTLDDGRWALGWERTNRREAVLVRIAPRGTERFSTDLQVYRKAGDATQLGANFSYVARDDLLVHTEWAGGRQPHRVSPNETSGGAHWANRLAVGATWTSPWRWAITAERHVASSALSRDDWQAWRNLAGLNAAARLGALRHEVGERQDLLVRNAYFVRVAWDQAFDLRSVDAAALLRLNPYDHSRSMQLDVAWHLNARCSLRAILGRNVGAGAAEHSSQFQRASVAVYLQAYL